MPALVAECLALRAWTLHVLAGGPPAEIPTSSPSAWAHFLTVERCALPLSTRLAAVGHHTLPVAARAQLDRATHSELQRVLAARGQLAGIDLIASEREWDVVVLKGAVALGDPRRAVDLADLDLLTAPDDARALVAALDAGGYRKAGSSSPLHLATRATEGGLPVEVHTRLGILDRESFETLRARSVPMAETKRLRRLASRDHLLHLLTHVGVAHPYRRGSIRDLLLLAQAVRECSAREIEEARAMIERHRYATELPRLLDMACGLAAEQGLVVDEFRYPSGAVYAVIWWDLRLPLPQLLKADIGMWAIALLRGRGDVETEWAKVTMRTLGPSFAGPIARVERTMPRVGRMVRVISRLIRVAVAMLFAVPLALLAGYEARRAIRALG
ncbi:MAG: nucleotidyltransferase family protein [Gemmatimonadota bacterium]|nr:nucleotidyltransferase family protein [Gemmatimonadota bacterium]MDH3478664.1 nucleotidyltransferase family protein [Gemmatimonadota bacterium]MDH3571310.1 nucleotidyltransferase family protein [Gemmatimonadota bacterium]MDH5550992.1 nucleotidyltransferase family protein [Gemmatimonadota bacterium]